MIVKSQETRSSRQNLRNLPPLEPVSKIAKHDFHAAEADHAEEVLDVVLPARDQAAKIVQPGEEPLYRPASSITTQGSSILSRVLPVSAMGRDHLDVVLCPQVVVQGTAVVGFVSNQPGRELAEEAVPQCSSTSWLSCGEAAWTLTAIGRLSPAVIAVILVPFPRLVGPMPSPLFSRPQRWRR